MSSLPDFLHFLNKPEYVFRPRNIFRRLMLAARSDGPYICHTSFGIPLTVAANDTIGHAIAKTGVYELAVAEALWRLLSHEDTAVDVGANIGFMTALMAKRVGSGGRVFSFEPSEYVLPLLRTNVVACGELTGAAIVLVEAAVADEEGGGMLLMPVGWDDNHGLAFLARGPAADGQVSQSIATCRLDAVLRDVDRVRVMKVDVEGGELEVLRGCGSLLSSRRIDNVLYEDHYPQPSPVTLLLRSYGYETMRLDKGFYGPVVREAVSDSRLDRYSAPTFVASVDGSETRSLLAKSGWRVLK